MCTELALEDESYSELHSHTCLALFVKMLLSKDVLLLAVLLIHMRIVGWRLLSRGGKYSRDI